MPQFRNPNTLKAHIDAIDLAYYIISIREYLGAEVRFPNAKLQFILYLLQMNYLAEQKEPLFSNQIEAWNYGPCVPDAYYEFCTFGGLDIDRALCLRRAKPVDLPLATKLFVLDHAIPYIKLSFRELHELVTQEGGAYKTIVGMYGLKPRHEIPLDLIYMEAARGNNP